MLIVQSLKSIYAALWLLPNLRATSKSKSGSRKRYIESPCALLARLEVDFYETWLANIVFAIFYIYGPNGNTEILFSWQSLCVVSLALSHSNSVLNMNLD